MSATNVPHPEQKVNRPLPPHQFGALASARRLIRSLILKGTPHLHELQYIDEQLTNVMINARVAELREQLSYTEEE